MQYKFKPQEDSHPGPCLEGSLHIPPPTLHTQTLQCSGAGHQTLPTRSHSCQSCPREAHKYLQRGLSVAGSPHPTQPETISCSQTLLLPLLLRWFCNVLTAMCMYKPDRWLMQAFGFQIPPAEEYFRTTLLFVWWALKLWVVEVGPGGPGHPRRTR